MSDAIEAAAKALCLATGLDWDSIEDAEDGDGLDSPLGPETKRYFRQWFNAALTAYEAAKGGGVGAWQWHDFSGNWYTVDSARMTLADQEKLAKACAEDHGGRARPLYANPKPDGSALTSPASGERDAPAGYVLVPVEPTEGMLAAGMDSLAESTGEPLSFIVRDVLFAYRAMVAALRMEGK